MKVATMYQNRSVMIHMRKENKRFLRCLLFERHKKTKHVKAVLPKSFTGRSKLGGFMNTLQTMKMDGYGIAGSAAEVKKYSDKELNDRIAKAKRKAVEKFIRKLGYADEEAMQDSLHYEGKADLLFREATLKQDNQKLGEELNRCRRLLMLYEQNVDPIFFEFILYSFHDESDAETFQTKLQKFMEDHPQYSKAYSQTDEFHPFVLLYKNI